MLDNLARYFLLPCLMRIEFLWFICEITSYRMLGLCTICLFALSHIYDLITQCLMAMSYIYIYDLTIKCCMTSNCYLFSFNM